MANGRNKTRNGDTGRDSGGFVALPWTVLDCPAYASLSHPARSLLMEVARQFVRDNNGKMLLSIAYLNSRGWFSAGVIQKAKQELLDSGFIFETVKGHWPKTASRYAVTWRSLDKSLGYDLGAAECFKRGAYRLVPAKAKRTAPNCKNPKKNASLIPSDGTYRAPIVPCHGIESVSIVPSHGTIEANFQGFSIPSDGHYLDMPSVGVGFPARWPRLPELTRQNKVAIFH
jgi:hypothetical protein